MQMIEMIFDEGKFRYTQIERHGDLAIYCQELKSSNVKRYEVVRLRVQKAYVFPSGVSKPEREVYPTSRVWGKDGWTHFTLDDAQRHMRTLQAETH